MKIVNAIFLLASLSGAAYAQVSRPVCFCSRAAVVLCAVVWRTDSLVLDTIMTAALRRGVLYFAGMSRRQSN